MASRLKRAFWHEQLQILHVSMVLVVIFAVSSALYAADFHPPAGDRYALVASSGTILPGGRFLKPFGTQIQTGPGPLGLAVSPSGTVATADSGYERFGITVIDPPAGRTPWRVHHIWARTLPGIAREIAGSRDWTTVASGITFDSAKSLWVSEGASGRVHQIDVATGSDAKFVNLNGDGWHDSFTADLAFDRDRRLLYVVDQSNARVAVIDARAGLIVSSVRVDSEPSAVALAPDASTLYVTGSKSVCVVDVRDAGAPEVTGRIQTRSPSAILATADRVFVSNAFDDTITVISSASRKVLAEIPLTIPMLERFRGVAPAGLAYDPVTKWLLVAETGINAVGIVDTEKNQLIGNLPAGWMPTRVAISGDRVFVANARGRGTGPSPRRAIFQLGEVPVLHRGSVTTFVMPDESEVLRQTATVFSLNGLAPYMHDPPKPVAPIRYVVLIAKGNRTFDEVLGDMVPGDAAPGDVARLQALPSLARFGMHGRGDGGKEQFSVKDAPITPNQHAIARRWAFSDNFYADGDTGAEGEIWLRDGYPDLAMASRILASRDVPAPGNLWDHLQRAGVTFQELDAGSVPGISDQARADRFIAEIDRKYVRDGEPFPRFLLIRLPNDRAGSPRPRDGYPYAASFVLDNDFATGRILDYLSHSRWWRDMAVFAAETDTQGSLDHVDAHRTLLLVAGPWIKRNYVSHTNASFPGLWRTIFESLGVPPLNLLDATAASLRDIFSAVPDYAPFTAIEPDGRIFDPTKLPKP